MARKYIAYKDSYIDLVSEYTYLGIPLSRTALPGSAVEAAVSRARQATTATLAGVSRLGVNSWGSFLTLYNSMIFSILLYAVPAWGLQCGEDLEVGQLDFFKSLLFLPRGTPGWALRLELNILPLEYKIMTLIWNWFIKILESSNDFLPKICLLRLIKLAEDPACDKSYNWALKFKNFLESTDAADLWNCFDSIVWKERAPSVFASFRTYLIQRDLDRAQQSLSCQFKIARELPLNDNPANYLLQNHSLRDKRIIAHIRLANIYTCTFYPNKNCKIAFNLKNCCNCCETGETDNLVHLFLTCPKFAMQRTKFANVLSSGLPDRNSFHRFLNNCNFTDSRALCNFLVECLLIKAEVGKSASTTPGSL